VPLLLNCWDPTVFFDFDLQGIDQQPRDTPSDSGTFSYLCVCGANLFSCVLWNLRSVDGVPVQ
jgi:hypothetical protein